MNNFKINKNNNKVSIGENTIHSIPPGEYTEEALLRKINEELKKHASHFRLLFSVGKRKKSGIFGQD